MSPTSAARSTGYVLVWTVVKNSLLIRPKDRADDADWFRICEMMRTDYKLNDTFVVHPVCEKF